MEILRFDKEVGKKINNYNSISSFYTMVMKSDEATQIGFINIAQGGIVGYHEAPAPQLFIVVQGEGWVQGEDNNRIMIKSGEGVLWKKGEGHASGSVTGLTALVLQSENLNSLVRIASNTPV